MEKLNLKIGKKIRSLRVEKGYSQEKLAEMSNLHRNYIGMVERGEKNITVEKLSQILDSLNLTLEKFFEEI